MKIKSSAVKIMVFSWLLFVNLVVIRLAFDSLEQFEIVICGLGSLITACLIVLVAKGR
jgi:hypothetical protein